MDNDDIEDLSNTILKTPRPQASSTVTKSRPEFREETNNLSKESLGILPIEYTDGDGMGREFTTFPSLKMSEKPFKLNETLLESRRKAQKTMKTSSMQEDSFNCDSAFNEHSIKCWLESTVNETDVMDKPRTKLFESINNLTMELKQNTTENLSDIFEKHMENNVNSQMDSGMFTPAELFVDNFFAGNVLKPSNKEFDTTLNERMSMQRMSYGEFFRKKSDNDSSLFNKTSPIKGDPVCLASFRHSNESSKTRRCEENELETLSVSQIKNLISDENSKLMNIFFSDCGENAGLNSKSSGSCIKNFLKPKVQFSKSVTNSEESNKENVDNSINKSVSVIQSSSSMESLSRISLSLQCNRTELVWSCVKVGKVRSHSITFRNRNSYKTRFQICLTNPNYKILTPDRDFTSTFIELFHANESKQYTVRFIPTREGPCIGKMTFTPIVKGDLQPSQTQLLNLYGYGGHSNIDTRDVIKDTTGKYLITFGKIAETLPPIKFLIKNSGTIPGFAAFTFTPKKLYMFSNLKIVPESVLVGPSKSTTISLYYTPSKQDFKHINALFGSGEDVFQLGTITMVTGSEITRCRLKNHRKKIEQTHLQLEPLIQQVTSCVFPNEDDTDSNHFNEGYQSIKELQKELQQREFVVTIQSDPDKTLHTNQTMDETSKYFTLINNMCINPNSSSFV